MIKHQSLVYPAVSRLKLRFSNFSGGVNTTIDENLLPINYAKMSYNTNFKDKALKTGLGFKELSLPYQTQFGERNLNYDNAFGNINGVWIFPRYLDTGEKADLLFVHADDNAIYHQPLYSDYDIFSKFFGFEYVGKPNVLFHKYQNNDVAVLTSETDSLAIWNGVGAPAKVANTLNLTSICVHYERLFATVSGRKNIVRFSANFDLTEWDESPEEGGFIEFVDERGECNKVLSFNDYVYIIREHGISRLSAYGEQDEFSVTHLFLSADKIYHNTAVLCGDRILMLCSDGLYSFNGYTATKYNLKINDMFVNEKMDNAFACYFNGKYYLACNLNFFDDDKVGVETADFHNNALFEFDLKSGDYTITRGIDIRHLTPVVDGVTHKLAVVFGDEEHRKVLGELTDDGCFFGVPLQKKWVSPMSDFGYPDKIKVVREVHLLTKYDIKLTIESECESRTFEIAGKSNISKIMPNVKGQRISLTFLSLTDKMHVSNPNVVVDLI